MKKILFIAIILAGSSGLLAMDSESKSATKRKTEESTAQNTTKFDNLPAPVVQQEIIPKLSDKFYNLS